MKKIEEIIRTIDDELIEKDKPYLILGQANKLLASKNVITVSEKINGTLKKLLEENKIPHAFQTKKSPKQWIIPISDKGQIRKNNLPDKKVKTSRSQRKSKTKNNSQKTTTVDSSNNWIVGAIITILIIAFAIGFSGSNTGNNETLENDFSNIKLFVFSSEFYDIEQNGRTVKTVNDVTYHKFNLKQKLVTQTSWVNGEKIIIKYPFKKFYVENGIVTNYIFIVNNLGLKEIWWSPDVQNLGYDYMDGTRIACYNLRLLKKE